MTSKIVRARCPGCMGWLKVPMAALNRHIRCTHCQTVSRPEKRRREKQVDAPPAAVNDDLDGENFFDQWEHDEGPSASGFPIAPLHRTKPYGARRSYVGPIVMGVMAVLLATAGTLLYVYRDHLGAASTTSQEAKPNSPPVVVVKGDDGKGPEMPTGLLFPRRLMVVSINQYLYANPILFGAPKRSPVAVLDRLADRWRVPRDQVYFLSDAATNRGAVAPIKPVLEASLASYLATSRPQDRIALVYAGHCTTLDGVPYLVPLDGELTVKESLVPLTWLFDKLKACPARQKLLVFDTCRFDPGRGVERPAPGPMSPELEAMLKTPPAGVQVWSSCSAGQQSFEFRYQAFDNFEVEGSLFLNQFFAAFLKAGPGIPKPEDPLPLDDLVAHVGPQTEKYAIGVQMTAQTPFLAGAAANGGADYDASQPPAERVVLAKPSQFVAGTLADPAFVKAIFSEIKVPPPKALAAGEASTVEELDTVIAFSNEALQPYLPDYESIRQIIDHPEKYPLRVGVINALAVLERHGKGDVKVGPNIKRVTTLRDEIEGPIDEKKKTDIEREQKTGPAMIHVELEELVQTLDKLKPQREKETAKRWQANYDYVRAMAKARFAYVNEYNLLLGKIRKDELPTLTPGLHRGWRIASVDKLSSPRDVKDQADEARKLFNQLIKDHPGTPWEVLAKRERLAALGLIWQPAAIRQ